MYFLPDKVKLPVKILLNSPDYFYNFFSYDAKNKVLLPKTLESSLRQNVSKSVLQEVYMTVHHVRGSWRKLIAERCKLAED